MCSGLYVLGQAVASRRRETLTREKDNSLSLSLSLCLCLSLDESVERAETSCAGLTSRLYERNNVEFQKDKGEPPPLP